MAAAEEDEIDVGPDPSIEETASPEPTAEGPAVGTRLSAREIHENVRVAAEEELNRPVSSLAWSGVAAGLTIGFSFLFGSYLSSLVPEPYGPAAAAAGYPLGFVFVVLARNQLFTENTLEPLIPVLSEPTLANVGRMLRLWVVVLAANLVGALAFASLVALTPMISPELRHECARVAEAATSGGFVSVAYRAIFGGWLVALMAWLVASTRSTGAQIALVWLTTAPIAAFEFRHSIAGSVEAFYRAFSGAAGWGEMIGQFIVPAVLGNIVGGFLFVALLNHSQVAAERDAASEDVE